MNMESVKKSDRREGLIKSYEKRKNKMTGETEENAAADEKGPGENI